ncbi:hypothetical protein BD413DRAFT_617245 [Trametes elegans]|nr:hypothetical protein BD413DRAFT_617245 [Trametes elegans]
MTTAPHLKAEQLKNEGNDLFVRKDYAAACKKYTEAIALDDKNAILNLDACDDATKATELDPAYAKAWARLAMAHMGIQCAKSAAKELQKALDALPADDTIPAVRKQRAEYTARLEAAKNQPERLSKQMWSRAWQWLGMQDVPDADLPWNRTADKLDGMEKAGFGNSSAYIIDYSRLQWERGLQILDELMVFRGLSHWVSRPNMNAGADSDSDDDRLGIVDTELGCIEHLSEALFTDHRTLRYMKDVSFLDKYVQQFAYECHLTGGWGTGGPRKVIQEATDRFNAGGHDAVRHGLELTIRNWVILGFIQVNHMDDAEHGQDYYTSALEVMEWAYQLWSNVPLPKRGYLFQPSYIRTVKCLRLEAYMAAHKKDPGPNSKFPLKEIRTAAEQLLGELLPILEDQPTCPKDGSKWTHLAFVRYPLGARAFSYLHDALETNRREGRTPRMHESFALGAQDYLKAAEFFPEDDEYHVLYLHCAFKMLLEIGRPAGEILDLLDRIHDLLPKMKEIWKISLVGPTQARDKKFEEDMKIRDDLLKSIEEGLQ